MNDGFSCVPVATGAQGFRTAIFDSQLQNPTILLANLYGQPGRQPLLRPTLSLRQIEVRRDRLGLSVAPSDKVLVFQFSQPGIVLRQFCPCQLWLKSDLPYERPATRGAPTASHQAYAMRIAHP